MEKGRGLGIAQHAHLKEKGTETAVVSTEIQHKFEGGRETLGGFIDVEGAFDNTSSIKIIEVMLHHDVSSEIIEWTYQALKTRELRTHNETLGKIYRTVKGMGQGTCSAPLQWCMILGLLLANQRENNTKVIAYAYDLAILATSHVYIACRRE